jgi:hypothetical protein
MKVWILTEEYESGAERDSNLGVYASEEMALGTREAHEEDHKWEDDDGEECSAREADWCSCCDPAVSYRVEEFELGGELAQGGLGDGEREAFRSAHNALQNIARLTGDLDVVLEKRPKRPALQVEWIREEIRKLAVIAGVAVSKAEIISTSKAEASSESVSSKAEA